MFPASQEDMQYRLSSLTAGAPVVRYARYSLLEEEMLGGYLFGSQSDQQRTLPLAELRVQLQYLLCWLRYIPETDSASAFIGPLVLPGFVNVLVRPGLES